MRTIKFRAWDKVQKKMFKDCIVPEKNTSINHYFEIIQKNANITMQFTGLKDKNGKEIYEGDLVADRENSEYIHEVVWMEHLPGFGLKEFPSREYNFEEEVANSKVIGNIYQNPELLKGGE